MNYTTTLTIKQFCIRYNLSPATAYRLMNKGVLPYRKVGRRRLIAVIDAENWWNALPVSPPVPALPMSAQKKTRPRSRPDSIESAAEQAETDVAA
ncbi:helix-turn-helix domain-containing protein [Afipia sp. DC4300-2b1]|uniref:helix-turn-helix domain-containing protein n=1 Tax=Afipia sp. DC4300-2b1 TaxID=2804672 RepID=UPI003CF00D14